MTINVDEFTDRLIEKIKGRAHYLFQSFVILKCHKLYENYHLCLKDSVGYACGEIVKEYPELKKINRSYLVNKLIKYVFAYLKHYNKEYLKKQIQRLFEEV